MDTADTIVALATPKGNGALAVIRVSGNDVHGKIVQNIVEEQKFKNVTTGKIGLYTYRKKDCGEIIDEVTMIKYIGPKSYTGENMVEIICHGGEVVVERILETLLENGIRYAKKGEFTRRAFCNGKMDLIKAEAVNNLISSTTVTSHKNAIKGYFGEYQEKIKKWIQTIEEILIEIESEIEFNEEYDIRQRKEKKELKEKIKKIKCDIDEEIQRRNKIKEIEKGVTIAIIGKTNAGKSSIFNLIVGYGRSIVNEKEGTTRDFVTETKKVHETTVTFIDTAGLNTSNDSIEKEGVERAKKIQRESDVILWITAANERITEDERRIKNEEKNILGIINKIDIESGEEKETLFKQKKIPFIKVTAKEKTEKNKIIDFIYKKTKEIYSTAYTDCVITSKRQEFVIKEIQKEIEQVEHTCEREEEICAIHCKNILEKFEEVSGKVTSEEIMNKIFEEFCIGK